MAEKPLLSIIPEPVHFLELEPEELAGPVLEWLNSIEAQRFGLVELIRRATDDYQERYRDDLQKAFMETWSWLVREGLVARYPSASIDDFYFVSRRGKRVAQATDLAAYRRADMLPRRLLHPVIAQKVFATFLRGDYDIAVFQALKEVEVAVRTAGGYADNDYGTAMMRRAFHVDTGPLTDASAVVSERQGRSDLFAGAFGAYKNPQSHRNMKVEPTNAVELIMHASHLLKIVDSHALTRGEK